MRAGPGLTIDLHSLLTGLLLMKKITSVCPYCGAGCKLKLVVDTIKLSVRKPPMG